MKSHKDLIVWQKSMEHVAAIYVATRAFPKDELFGIVSQMRRAACQFLQISQKATDDYMTRRLLSFLAMHLVLRPNWRLSL